MSSSSRLYLWLAVLVGGATTMAVEFSISRLIENYFGTSNLIWANVIALIMLCLAAGYYFGGRWADAAPHPRTFYTLQLWSALTVGIVPLLGRPVLLFAAQAVSNFEAALVGASFLGALTLMIVPITLLGMVSPFAIRLVTVDARRAGQSAGQIYAISTLGSLVGTYAATLLVIPGLGVRQAFLLFAAILMTVSWIGLFTADRKRALYYLWMPVALAVSAWVASAGVLRPIEGLKDERESAYNFIQVVERNGTRYLLLNEGQGIHSIYNPNELATGWTWDHFLIGPYFNPPPHTPSQVQSLGLVGLAAGTSAKQFTAVYGPIPIDGIEVDTEIVEVGRKWFDMNEPNLNVIIADGRWALSHSGKRYSVIGLDAYRLPYIPWHLTTHEFFAMTREHLTDDGVVVINVGRTPYDRSLINAMAATLQTVFPSVYVVDIPETFNSIVYATVQPTRAENLRANLALLGPDAHPLLRTTLERAITNLQPAPTGGTVFTDDVAPVEIITNNIVLSYILRP